MIIMMIISISVMNKSMIIMGMVMMMIILKHVWLQKIDDSPYQDIY